METEDNLKKHLGEEISSTSAGLKSSRGEYTEELEQQLLSERSKVLKLKEELEKNNREKRELRRRIEDLECTELLLKKELDQNKQKSQKIQDQYSKLKTKKADYDSKTKIIQKENEYIKSMITQDKISAIKSEDKDRDKSMSTQYSDRSKKPPICKIKECPKDSVITRLEELLSSSNTQRISERKPDKMNLVIRKLDSMKSELKRFKTPKKRKVNKKVKRILSNSPRNKYLRSN